MKNTTDLINRKFYEAILAFEESEEAQDYFYQVMDTETERVRKNGEKETIRDRILRVYSMLFCDDLGAEAGQIAGFDEVAATADRLYVGELGFDPSHWYRMQHHFPVIDEDNYERFAALVIADLKSGSLHDAAVNGGQMLLVGELDPLSMTKEQRENQKVRAVSLDAQPESGEVAGIAGAGVADGVVGASAVGTADAGAEQTAAATSAKGGCT